MKILGLDQKAASTSSCTLSPLAQARDVDTLRRSCPLGMAAGSAFFMIRHRASDTREALRGFLDL